MYVARDKDGNLYLFQKRPRKSNNFHVWLEECINMIKLDSSLFPEVSWEDEEPTEVELVKKEKV